MESTGVKGRIQVSEATSKYLKVAGKDGWLTQREDAVKVSAEPVFTAVWLLG